MMRRAILLVEPTMSKKAPSAVRPYTVYRSTPSLLVEKTGTKGGQREKPKAYHGHVVRESRYRGSYQQTSCHNDWDTWIDSNAPWARMESKLYAKIQELLGEDAAEIGTTLAEYHQAIQMITSSATRLSHAAAALGRGNFRYFLSSIRAKPLHKHVHWTRSLPKDASNLWIEYWFGWSPTIHDIRQAAKILDSDPPTGSIPFKVATGASSVLKRNQTMSTPSCLLSCTHYAKAGGSFELVNPNLALAQRLGVLNPLTIAVNVTPWSWLLGWFVNVNQYVDSLTGFSGYKFTDCYTTQFTKFKGYKTWYFGPSKFADYQVEGMLINRYLRLPKVRLHFKRFNLSLTRAATAVSLLTLRLKSLDMPSYKLEKQHGFVKW